MTLTILQFTIPLLYLAAFGGLAYVALQSFSSGADAFTSAYTEETVRGFEDIFLFIPPRRIMQLAWAAASMVFLITLTLIADFHSLPSIGRGAIFGIIAGACALFTPKLVLLILRQRRLLKFNFQLVDALMTMSNALKAGFSIMQACESVVRTRINPVAQEFNVFLQQVRLGVSFEDGMQNMQERVRSEDLSLVVSAIETARMTGGNLTEVLESIAHTIRERMRIERRINTLTSQGRLQGIVVGSLPVLLGALLLFWKPQMMKPFFHSHTGTLCLIVVAINLVLGGLLIRKIIRIDV